MGDDHFIDDALRKVGELRPRITVSDVIEAICRAYCCSLTDLSAPGKMRPFAEARAVASLLIQEMPHIPLVELGKVLNRDIAPLGRGGRRIREVMAEDEGLQVVVDNVRKHLREWQKG